MKIDAHQHFWRYRPEQFPWIGADKQILANDFLPAHLAPLVAASGIAATVAVQARQSLEETRFLLELAGAAPWIAAVVGWVDLRGPDVARQLESFGGNPRLKGIRHLVHDEPDDRFMLDPAFLRGLAALAPRGLTYDLLVFPRHLSVCREVAARFPNQRFVVDHIAKPPIAAGGLEPWATDLRLLARLPNVWCKVSGLDTEASWRDWQLADFHPYLDVVFEAFGSARIMFGSDWPVCNLAGTYADAVRIVSDYVARLAPDEQADVWGGTARGFYDLG